MFTEKCLHKCTQQLYSLEPKLEGREEKGRKRKEKRKKSNKPWIHAIKWMNLKTIKLDERSHILTSD